MALVNTKLHTQLEIKSAIKVDFYGDICAEKDSSINSFDKIRTNVSLTLKINDLH